MRKRLQNSRQHQRRDEQQRDHDREPDPEDDGMVQMLFHFGVGTNRPVGRNNRVRISTMNETITAWDGFTQIAA